jgi:hypothetical protein
MPERAFRAGESLEDFCRVCKTDRMHTVIAADPQGRPLRVACGYCRSEHNYRGGPRVVPSVPSPSRAREPRGQTAQGDAFPIVAEAERSAPPIMLPDAGTDLELVLGRLCGVGGGVPPAAPAEKWRGGALVLRPGRPGLQEKTWPIETFFHKVVMLRNRLRALEQHVNASDLPEDAKVKLQAYVSGCYGTLTSFNVLFADEEDQFKGAGGD